MYPSEPAGYLLIQSTKALEAFVTKRSFKNKKRQDCSQEIIADLKFLINILSTGCDEAHAEHLVQDRKECCVHQIAMVNEEIFEEDCLIHVLLAHLDIKSGQYQGRICH